MIIPIIIVFVISSIAYYKTPVPNKIKKNIIISLWILLFLIVGFRPEQMPDYSDYKIGFDLSGNDDFGRWEPLYWLLMKSIHAIKANFSVLILLMAMLSVGIRLFSINKVTPYFWGSIVVYISNLFILHDMIQIRCAVASGLLILAVYYKVNNQLKNFLISSTIAFLFHYSAIIILPLWYLGNNTKRRNFFLSLIPLSYLLVVSGLFHSSILFGQIPYFGYYIQAYADNIQQETVNIFNGLQMLRCVICMLLWICIRIIDYDKYFIIFLKIYTISLCCLPLFSDVYVVAYRISEFYLISEIIVIPYLAYILKPYYKLGKLLVINISTIFLLMNIFYNKYLI